MQLINLNDSREAVYGTLDGWVAWEKSFPLVSLKRILITLEKEEQWHRVVQVLHTISINSPLLGLEYLVLILSSFFWSLFFFFFFLPSVLVRS